MLRNILCMIGIAGGLLLVSLSAVPVRAGQTFGMNFSCAQSGDNRVCYGSLRGANLSERTTDYAQFRLDGAGFLYFAASHQGKQYDCVFDREASARLGTAAVTGDYNMYFYINIDAQNQCMSTSFLVNSSVYQANPKP